HLILPRRIPSRRRLVNSMKSAYRPHCSTPAWLFPRGWPMDYDGLEEEVGESRQRFLEVRCRSAARLRPSADRARAGSRLMLLMKAARRKRTADQSSSMAIMRTPSKPAAPRARQPPSRLSSHVYRIDVPFG